MLIKNDYQVSTLLSFVPRNEPEFHNDDHWNERKCRERNEREKKKSKTESNRGDAKEEMVGSDNNVETTKNLQTKSAILSFDAMFDNTVKTRSRALMLMRRNE